MNRWLLTLVAFVFIAVTELTAAPNKTYDRDTFGPYGKSVVRVVTEWNRKKDGKRVTSFGTGVVVQEGVLTAWHVVDESEVVNVMKWDDTIIPVKKWQRVEESGDVAILAPAEDLGLPVVKTSKLPGYGTNRCRVVGYFGVLMASGRPVITQADLVRNDDWEEELRSTMSTKDLFVVHAPAMPGMSGSPVFVDGGLVGLVSASNAAAGSYVAMIPPSALILEALAKASPKITITIEAQPVK